VARPQQSGGFFEPDCGPAIRKDRVMVVLILTRAGFEDMRPRIDRSRDVMWVGGDVLTAAEVAELRRSGFDVTDFAHRLDPRNLESDIGTVVEHHLGQILWVETVAG
jgi:hypothetical protein